MKNKISLLLFSTVLFFAACSQKEETTAAVSGTDTTGQSSVSLPSNDGSALSSESPFATPGTETSAPAASGSSAPNPEHGQPGHRCDIEVGAPLNSAPTKTVTPAASTQQPTSISTPVPSAPKATKTVAAGMNPEHGQPGHRCDIEVGAPLNSPPGNASKPMVSPALPAAK